MDGLVDKRATDGKGTPDVKTGLRWAGFSAETALENALMFWRYNFENGIEPDVIDSVAYAYTDEDGELISFDKYQFLPYIMFNVTTNVSVLRTCFFFCPHKRRSSVKKSNFSNTSNKNRL